jgi:hypothetical protein
MPRRSLTALIACLAIACTSIFAASSFAGSSGSGTKAERGSAPVSAAASCKTVRYGGRSYVLYKKGVRCVFAKRWVRRLNRSQGRNKPAGFKCSSGSKFRSGGSCVRGNRVFGWHRGD